MITKHCSVEEPIDARGLPAPTLSTTARGGFPYGDLYQMIHTETPLLVFLDDLGQAKQDVQSRIMQLLDRREIDGQKISPLVRFSAAPTTHTQSGRQPHDLALETNSPHITIDVDVESWIS